MNSTKMSQLLSRVGRLPGGGRHESTAIVRTVVTVILVIVAVMVAAEATIVFSAQRVSGAGW